MSDEEGGENGGTKRERKTERGEQLTIWMCVRSE